MIPYSFPYPHRKRQRLPSSLARTNQLPAPGTSQPLPKAPLPLSRYPAALIEHCRTGHADAINVDDFARACAQFRSQLSSIMAMDGDNDSTINDSVDLSVGDLVILTPDAFLQSRIDAEIDDIAAWLSEHTESERDARAEMLRVAAVRTKALRQARYQRQRKSKRPFKAKPRKKQRSGRTETEAEANTDTNNDNGDEGKVSEVNVDDEAKQTDANRGEFAINDVDENNIDTGGNVSPNDTTATSVNPCNGHGTGSGHSDITVVSSSAGNGYKEAIIQPGEHVNGSAGADAENGHGENVNSGDADHNNIDSPGEVSAKPLPAPGTRVKRMVFEGLDSTRVWGAPSTHISNTIKIPDAFGRTIPSMHTLVRPLTLSERDSDAGQLPLSLFHTPKQRNTLTIEAALHNQRTALDDDNCESMVDDTGVNGSEVVLRVSIYASALDKLLVSGLVLASQPLAALTQLLECCRVSDSTTSSDISMVIEHCHYNTRQMQSLTWRSLPLLRVGSHYHLLQQPSVPAESLPSPSARHHCHVFIVHELRALHRCDVRYRALYPLLTFRAPHRPTLCSVCHVLDASKVLYDDLLCDQNPTFFCRQCYDALHLDGNGELLYGGFAAFELEGEDSERTSSQ